MKHLLLLSNFLLINTFIFGQVPDDLFMPIEFRQAYLTGTRDKSGAPGPHYWQNESSYDIEAQIDPENKILTGTANITYFNNSPDTIPIIVVRLYHDLYKKGNARDRRIDPLDVTDGIDLKKVKISDEKIDLDNRFLTYRSGTNLFMRMPEKLLPNDSVVLSMDWQTSIPEETLIRMGAIDKSSMFVAYWYPQISVYDDIDGWDYFDYGSRQEFYQDLAQFHVSIKVPSDFLVWATGDLMNAKSIYSDKVIENLNKAGSSDATVLITDNPKKGQQTKKNWTTWNYLANDVPDFAFAISDHYIWEASSVVLDSMAMERIMVHTVYNEESRKRFQHVTEYQRQSLLYFSHGFPGIKYPFHQFTTFQGLKSGGMEFPMMANNGDYSGRNDTLDRLLTLEVTAHEIAHSYMPFYILVNERKYTWMEEGWATLFGERATTRIQPMTGIPDRYSMQERYKNRFYTNEGTQFSVPLMTPTIVIKNASTHFHISYYKAYYAYVTLQNILGNGLFNKALKEYIRRWKGKHPTPYDFFYTFNDVTEQNLNWFWAPWFFEFAYPDLAIKEVKNGEISIINEGKLPVPIRLRVIFQDNSMKLYAKNADIWKKTDVVNIKSGVQKEIRSVEIIGSIVPDVNPVNDLWKK